MRRILAAAAALVLAFGVVLVGATMTYADDTSSFALTTDPVYNDSPLNFTGHLDAFDYVSGFTYSMDGGTTTDWDVADDCTAGIQVGSSTASDFSCNVPFPADFTGTNFVITANISEPSQANSPTVAFTADFTVVPGSYTDHYSATPTITDMTVGPAALAFREQLNGGADEGSVQVYPYGGGEESLCAPPQTDPTTCSLSGLAAGLYEIDMTQSWSDGGGAPTETNDVFDIPDAPSFFVDPSDPAHPALYSYAGTAGNQIIVDGPSSCGTVDIQVSEGPNWTCEVGPLAGGASYSYSAAEISQVPDGLDFDGEEYSFLAGTESALSDPTTIDVPVYLPNSSYAFTTGGITVHSTPTGEADRVGIELYSLQPGDGGYDYTLTEGCPDLESDDGVYQDIYDADAGVVTDCTFPKEGGTLAPGLWDAFSYDNYEPDADSSEGIDVVFTVPTTPTVDSASHNANSTTTVSGTGVAGDRVFAVADGVSGSVCNAVVGNDGTWSCTTSATFGGAQTFRSYDQDTRTIDISGYQSGGLSAVSDGYSVTLPAIATENPGKSTITPPAWTFTLTGIDLTDIHPGDTFTLHANGLPAGATITVVLHSTPVTLGTAVVAPDGTLNGTYTIPSDVPVGSHEIVLTMAGAGLTPTTSVQPVTIVAAAPTAEGTTTTTEPPKAAESSTSPSSHIAHVNPGSPTAPNILTRSIDPIQDVLAHPAKISAAVAIGLVLLIFATLPARLLNATVAENYENLVKRVPRLGRRPKWFESLSGWLKRTPVASAIILSAITAFLFGFADPDFGFTLASARLIMGLAIALFVVEYLANAVTGRIIRRAWSLTVTLNIRPLGLVLTVIGVIASRLLHFSPGFLIGLVLGLALTGKKAEEDAWKAVLVRSSVVLGFGLIAWVGYSALTTGAGGTETFWNQLFVEALVAITTEGIVAILVELLPFRLLEGERIWRKSRILWAVLYFFVIAGFIIAVVPWEGNWKQLGSALWVWIGVVAAFAAVCLAVYLYFRFWSPFHETEEEREEDEPIEIGAGG